MLEVPGMVYGFRRNECRQEMANHANDCKGPN